MTAPAALVQRLVPATGPGEDAVPARVWLDAHGLPTTREEAWRYTAVDDIVAALERAVPLPPVEHGVTRALVDELAGDHGGPRIVAVNGALATDLSDLDGLPAGVAVSATPRGVGRDGADTDPGDGFVALNELACRHTIGVDVRAGTRLDAPLHIVHLAVPGDGTSVVHPRTLVTAGPGSRVEVIETFAGRPGAVVTNASSRIVVGDGATVGYHRMQHEPGDAIHVGHTRIEQGAGAATRVTSVMAGAATARSAIAVRFDGADAVADLNGLYLVGGHQRHDNVITVDHAAPRCTSTQLFKGIVGGHGRGSFTGHVVVRPGAAGTDATQANHNLLLAPTAQTDTRPWLEILADEVRCVHGATVGRLDDDALFYLRSRGIPLAQSRALLVSGFASGIVDALTPESLRERVAAVVATHLAGARP